jgi:YidC/Oxa1 family membrane protein insertase
MQVTETDSGVQAQRVQADGLAVTTTWSASDEPHTLDVTVRFDNRGTQSVSDLWVGVVQPMSGEAGRFLNAVRSFAHVDGDVEHIDDLSDLEGAAQETLNGPVSWFGVGDKYFMAVLVPQDGTPASQVVVDTLPGGDTGAFLMDNQTLDAGASRTLRFQAYVGPKSLDLLSDMGSNLEDAVEFGWFGLFSRTLLSVLKFFQSLVGNWGIAIILLTLVVKLLFFPLTQKAFTSSRKMQAVQPQLNAIREKYKDNQQLQSQETMKLFQEHGVSPLGGCLPTLIQLPVWFALYNTMLYSVELYDTQFLYIQDLTAVDPYGVIPFLYAGLMFGQQRMMPMGSMDETQQKVMKAMPLIFAFFMFSFPSGLVLYFCVNMSLTIAQQWWIKRSVKDVPVTA